MVLLVLVSVTSPEGVFNGQVSDFFCRLIQRVAPKSYAQAGGEIKAVRTWLQDYSGNGVRRLEVFKKRLCTEACWQSRLGCQVIIQVRTLLATACRLSVTSL